MQRSVEVTRLAEADALRAFVWYLDNCLSERPALGFQAELRNCYRRIEQSAEQFPEYRRGARRALLQTYPYGVVFRIVEPRVIITAVMHLKQRPGFGARRSPG